MRMVQFWKDMNVTVRLGHIVGTEGDDVIEAHGVIDTVEGGAGDDIIWDRDGTAIPPVYGMPGEVWMPSDDLIFGGSGDDTIIAGLGADTLDGGDGVDTVDYSLSASAVIVDLGTGLGQGDANSASAGDRLFSIEIVEGSAHDDVLMGTYSTVALYGHDGDDTLVGRQASTTLFGGAGDDTLVVRSVWNKAHGGDGIDTLDLSNLNSAVRMGQGSFDAEVVATGAWSYQGWSSIERVIGTARNDYISMEGLPRGPVEVDGGAGDDILVGSSLDQATIFGGAGNDTIRGGRSADTLYGGNDHDRIFGGGGADHLFGGAGDDRLEGGDGNDWLTGGGGSDVFVFSPEFFQSVDIITDFRRGEDFIDLSAFDVVPGMFGDQALTYNATRAAGTVFATAEFGFTWIRAHLDGDRVADLTILLQGEVALTRADFFL